VSRGDEHETGISADTRPSDGSLVRRLRGGCQDAATQLYFRYAHRLHHLVKAQCSSAVSQREAPEDIVQSVFRRFFRKVSQGDYEVPEGGELWGLLLVMARNRIRSAETYHRVDKRDIRRTLPLNALPAETLSDAQGVVDESAYLTLNLCLAEALEQLPPVQRSMLELRIQGYEVAEIARTINRSKRTVERNLQEVRCWLRSRLAGEPADDPVDHPNEENDLTR
jgi:RNA polymerase sigma-70 factor (ECF subfamily)